MNPIFLLAVSPRSGSNYLFRLLSRHPDICPTGITGEDFLLRYSDSLINHIDKVSGNWKESWGNSKQELQDCMAEGWINFLLPEKIRDDQRLITKTPMPYGAENFFRLFPKGQLLIIIRNGPDAVESYQKTFDKSFEASVNNWALGARTILELRKNHAALENKSFKIVRYEDLYSNTSDSIKEIFSFLNLDPSKFDMEEALSQGVIGSSSQRDKGEEVSWKQEEVKSPDFDPTSRAKNWTNAERSRFDYLAGTEQAELGYSKLLERKSPLFLIQNWAKSAFIRFGLSKA